MHNFNNSISTKRLPAEWESQSAILIALPHKNSDWHDILDEVIECYKNIASNVIKSEDLIVVAPSIMEAKSIFKELDQSKIRYYEMPTNDTWARDFGGITIIENNKPIILDFVFNAWGLKFAANYDNLITSNLYNQEAFNCEYSNNLDFVLEGGSIESDGEGTILTTSECLLSKNRNGAMTKEQIEDRLLNSFGANRVLWLNHGALLGDDTDSHIDTLARLAPNNTIIYVGCDDEKDSNYTELKLMEEEILNLRTLSGDPYILKKLPSPTPIFFEDELLPATYANFLITNTQVLVPIYNQPEKDQEACNIIGEAFPNREIIGIDCNSLIKQHGSLHCVTMQFPKNVL